MTPVSLHTAKQRANGWPGVLCLYMSAATYRLLVPGEGSPKWDLREPQKPLDDPVLSRSFLAAENMI